MSWWLWRVYILLDIPHSWARQQMKLSGKFHTPTALSAYIPPHPSRYLGFEFDGTLETAWML
jgi:hypothetical protein